jgi:hypothetical protein
MTGGTSTRSHHDSAAAAGECWVKEPQGRGAFAVLFGGTRVAADVITMTRVGLQVDTGCSTYST